MADDDEVDVHAASHHLSHGGHELFHALAGVASAHGEDEGFVPQGGEPVVEEFLVRAVDRREEGRHAGSHRHHPGRVALEQFDRLAARVLGVGEDEIGRCHPRRPDAVPIEVGGGGEVVTRIAQRDQVVQGHDPRHTGVGPVGDDDEHRRIGRSRVQERRRDVVGDGRAFGQQPAQLSDGVPPGQARGGDVGRQSRRRGQLGSEEGGGHPPGTGQGLGVPGHVPPDASVGEPVDL